MPKGKVISSLTKEQEAKIKEYVEKGLKIGLSTEAFNPEEVIKAVNILYKAYDYKEPKVYFARSPKEGLKYTQLLREKGLISEEELANAGDTKLTWQEGVMAGCQELYWLYFYQYINNELPVDRFTGPLEETIALCEQVGWFWPHEEFIVITEKPTVLTINSTGVLHTTTGPAIKYSDGYELYALNGVRITELAHLMLAGANPKDILNVKNTEQRAELIKHYGIDKLFYELKPTLLDKANGYELYSISVYEGIPRIYLKMDNPSVPDEVHIEAVHPDCKAVDQALNWRNIGNVELPDGGFVPPVILT